MDGEGLASLETRMRLKMQRILMKTALKTRTYKPSQHRLFLKILS
jgi:hypothetical protein